MGIEEEFIKIQDLSPVFRSFLVSSRDKELFEFLKDKNIFAISGRRSAIKVDFS